MFKNVKDVVGEALKNPESDFKRESDKYVENLFYYQEVIRKVNDAQTILIFT